LGPNYSVLIVLSVSSFLFESDFKLLTSTFGAPPIKKF